MRSPIRVLVGAFLLLVPRIAAAAEFHVIVVEPMSLAFDQAGATFQGGTFDDIFIDGVLQETPWFSSFSGDVRFDAGQLRSLTVDNPEPDRATSHYEFDALGTFLLTAHWFDQFGNFVEGHYEAPLWSLLVDIRCEKELSQDDCGPFASFGDAVASFGPGRFDPALANILGLAMDGDAFEFRIALDEITGSPFSARRRVGGSAGGSEDLDIPVTIPEPSVVSLLLLSTLAGLPLRRRRVAARRTRKDVAI